MREIIINTRSEEIKIIVIGIVVSLFHKAEPIRIEFPSYKGMAAQKVRAQSSIFI